MKKNPEQLEEGPGVDSLVFVIHVPSDSMFNYSMKVLVFGRVIFDSRRQPGISGMSLGDSGLKNGAIGTFQIKWSRKSQSVRCRFIPAVDGFGKFEFEGSVCAEEMAVLGARERDTVKIARALLNGAEEFDPELPPIEVLAAYPLIASILDS